MSFTWLIIVSCNLICSRSYLFVSLCGASVRSRIRDSAHLGVHMLNVYVHLCASSFDMASQPVTPTLASFPCHSPTFANAFAVCVFVASILETFFQFSLFAVSVLLIVPLLILFIVVPFTLCCSSDFLNIVGTCLRLNYYRCLFMRIQLIFLRSFFDF